MAKRITGAMLSVLAFGALATAIPQAACAAPASAAALADRMQIEDLMVQYYTELTGGELHNMGDYFTADASMELDDRKLQSSAAITNFYATGSDRRVLPTNSYTMILSNIRTRVDGDAAVLDAIWTGYLCDNVKSTPRLVEQGTDHATLVRQDGVWKISSRIVKHLGGG